MTTLHDARQLRQLTQVQLATRSGVAQSVISRIERYGSQEITRETARRLAL